MPGPVKLILEIGVFEILEVQYGGVLNQSQAGIGAHALGEKTVNQGNDPSENVRRDGQGKFHGEQQENILELIIVQTVIQRFEIMRRLDNRDNAVNNQLSHIEYRYRQHSANKTQRQ